MGVNSICNEILRQGVFDYYKLDNETQFDQIIKKLFLMSKDHIESQIIEGSMDASIPIPIAKGFIQFEMGAAFNQDKFRRLKEMYLNNEENEISYSDKTHLIQRTANFSIVNAWSQCVQLTKNTPAFSLELESGNFTKLNSEILLSLTYEPLDGHPDFTTIRMITKSSNLQFPKTEDITFRVDAKLIPSERLYQKIVRTDKNEAFLYIAAKGFKHEIKIEMPPVPEPYINRVKKFSIKSTLIELRGGQKPFVFRTPNNFKIEGVKNQYVKISATFKTVRNVDHSVRYGFTIRGNEPDTSFNFSFSGDGRQEHLWEIGDYQYFVPDSGLIDFSIICDEVLDRDGGDPRCEIQNLIVSINGDL